MKFSTYSAITAAILSATSLNAFAADVNFYGKANLSVQSSDDGALDSDGKSKDSYTEVKSNASRIGFKGTQELSENLSVVYKAEFQVNMDEDDSDGDTLSARNQYVGLKGNFGTVLLGKNDSMLKQSQGKADVFSDYNGDIKYLWAGENRVSDSITYVSPKFAGLKLGVTYIAEDEADGDDGISAAVFYGDKSLKKSDFYASIAMDSDVKGQNKYKFTDKGLKDITRATVQGKVGGVVLGAMYHHEENSDGPSQEVDGFLVSAKYKMDNFTFKGQIQTASIDDTDQDTSAASVGVDYSLAKSTKVYVWYTSFDMDASSDLDKDYVATGIEYKF